MKKQNKRKKGSLGLIIALIMTFLILAGVAGLAVYTLPGADGSGDGQCETDSGVRPFRAGASGECRQAGFGGQP